MEEWRSHTYQPGARDGVSFAKLYSLESGLVANGGDTQFDGPLMNFAERYAFSVSQIEALVGKLKNFEQDGFPFCRTMATEKGLNKQLNNYLKKDAPNFYWNEHYQWALNEVGSWFVGANLKVERVTDLESAVNVLSKLDTSAGYVSLIDKETAGMKHKDYYLFQPDWFDSVYFPTLDKALEDGTFNEIVVSYKRIQGNMVYDDNGDPVESKVKRRLVQAVGLIQTIFARQFMKPLDGMLANQPWYGPGKNMQWMHASMNREKFTSFGAVVLDYSAYDSTIPAWLLGDAFSVARSAFAEGEISDDEWDLLVHDFIHKRILTPSGILEVHHGTSSGHPGTTAINTICNAIMTMTWAHAIQAEIKFNACGDDNCIFFKNMVVDQELVDYIASYITKNFGIECNPTKCGLYQRGESPKYCSIEWTDAGPTRNWREVVDHMAFPESFRDYKRDCRVEMVFYSYYLCYPVVMRQLFDMTKFFMDYGYLRMVNYQDLSQGELRNLPWSVRQAFLGEEKCQINPGF